MGLSRQSSKISEPSIASPWGAGDGANMKGQEGISFTVMLWSCWQLSPSLACSSAIWIRSSAKRPLLQEMGLMFLVGCQEKEWKNCVVLLSLLISEWDSWPWTEGDFGFFGSSPVPESKACRLPWAIERCSWTEENNELRFPTAYWPFPISSLSFAVNQLNLHYNRWQ